MYFASCSQKKEEKITNTSNEVSIDKHKLDTNYSGLFAFIASQRQNYGAISREDILPDLLRKKDVCFLSLSVYDPTIGVFNDKRAYYEISMPSETESEAVCGKLYYFFNYTQNHNLNYDDYTYRDRNGIWRTWYISDTTQQYGYFYIQRHHDRKHEFRQRVRVVRGDSNKPKLLEGFYWAISSLPYRLITEEDILQRKENEK